MHCKYYYFSYNTKYLYQNIIIYVLIMIVMFLIIQRIHIKDIIICVVILLFL
jgi:hypothetical protein